MEKTQKLEFKNKIASNEVIKSQLHLYLQDWSIHDGDVTPFAKQDVQPRYATWTNLYKSTLNEVVKIFTFQFDESVTKFYVVKVLLILMKFS